MIIKKTDDRTYGWAVGTSSLGTNVGTPDPRLVKTTDGGVTWVDENADFAGGINDIFFLDTNHGWAIGYYDILRYSNGVWNQIDNPTSYDLNSIFSRMNMKVGLLVMKEQSYIHWMEVKLGHYNPAEHLKLC